MSVDVKDCQAGDRVWGTYLPIRNAGQEPEAVVTEMIVLLPSERVLKYAEFGGIVGCADIYTMFREPSSAYHHAADLLHAQARRYSAAAEKAEARAEAETMAALEGAR